MPPAATDRLPPPLDLPPTAKVIRNRAGHWALLTPPAFEKLRYWTLYYTATGSVNARFDRGHKRPLIDFGPYHILHLRPVLDTPDPDLC